MQCKLKYSGKKSLNAKTILHILTVIEETEKNILHKKHYLILFNIEGFLSGGFCHRGNLVLDPSQAYLIYILSY